MAPSGLLLQAGGLLGFAGKGSVTLSTVGPNSLEANPLYFKQTDETQRFEQVRLCFPEAKVMLHESPASLDKHVIYLQCNMVKKTCISSVLRQQVGSSVSCCMVAVNYWQQPQNRFK